MLETTRLTLRWATLEDAAFLVELNKDPEVMRYTGDAATPTLQDAIIMIKERFWPQKNLYRMGRFIICLKDNTPIGWCGLRFFPETQEVDLGYRLMKKYWGQGHATEAARVCLEYGFQTLKLTRIIARAKPQNLASIKVMQKLGMNFKGVVKECTDQEHWVLYEMLRKNFKI